MFWPFTRSANFIHIATSCGILILTKEEYRLLELVLAGSITIEEGQHFYQLVIGRGLQFPLEWEAPILRATLAVFPERSDLSERLAIVEMSLGTSTCVSAEYSRLSWGKALEHFSRLSLINGDAESRSLVREEAFADACTLLSSSTFEKLPLPLRKATLITIHNTLLSAPGPDLIPIAELALHQLKKMLKNATLSLSDAMASFDAVHSLYFSGASDVEDLRRFDSITPYFESYLSERLPPNPTKSIPNPEAKLNIAYLLHTAHFDRGNAVSRLIVSLAEMHAHQTNRRIFLYLVQFVASDFLANQALSGVTVRPFPQDACYDRIDEIAHSLTLDDIDVVITEQNRAIASALFTRRVAPLQLWVDTGFPFWSLESLDWRLAPSWPGKHDLIRRVSVLRWRQKQETLKGIVDPNEVAATRRTFPENTFILGVFVRLIKLTPTFFALMDRILTQDSSYYLFIAGTGDDAAVNTFIAESPNSERIRFHHGNVDLNIYGQVIDVMCDTFPFIGGNACREVGAYGTPVVSMLGTPWDAFLRSERNPELLAENARGYLERLEKLRIDFDFRKSQREVTINSFYEQTNSSKMIGDIEEAIRLALSELH